MTNKTNNSINIVTQAFYGNRTATTVKPENIDRFILGYLDDFPFDYPIDRTIIKVPNTDNIVLVYNKYKEEEAKKEKEEVFKTKGYDIKPLATISEKNIKLYSRCIACRINTNGELESLLDEDYDKLINYLAE